MFLHFPYLYRFAIKKLIFIFSVLYCAAIKEGGKSKNLRFLAGFGTASQTFPRPPLPFSERR